MPMYSAFAPSILGMNSQAHSLATISQNIANVTAGGYKRTETRFQTVLSDSMSSGQDFGGVRPKDVQVIDQQGLIYTTARDLDLAIVGDGFFVVGDAVTGGNTYYTRDGSFEMKVLTATTGTGSATSVPGYMVDKNGLYLMGWAPDANGVFPISGTLQAMRVDPDYFANVFQATTTAEVGLNLPAMATATPAVAQTNTVTIAGTIEAGDVYSVTVAGTTRNYTTTGLEADINVVRDNLISQVNAAALGVTARANGTGTMTLIANTAGTAFTASAAVNMAGGVIGDNTATNSTTIANVTAQSAHATAVANAIAGTPPAGYYSFSISVIDSAGKRQPVQLNFTRSDENTWLMSATHSRTPTAQVNTVTLAGAVEPGDSYTVTVAGTAYTYTHTGATATIDTARNALVSLINAGSSSPVTAAAGATGVLTLTAKTAGSAFTSSTSATNVTSTADNTANVANTVVAGVGVAQIDDVTIAGTIEAGDAYSITVNGTTFSYTLTATDTMNTARDALIALVNADAVLPVTASANGAGVVRLTADAVNTPFATVAAATNIGGGAANTASIATTTANVTNNTTTATSTINFTNNGYAGTRSGSTITAPSAVSFALTFNGGSTASFTLDVASMTQFDSGFLASRQDTNGFEKSNLMRTTWDEQGFLVGHFTNDNSRKLYQVPLANFISPNSLQMKSGMIFEETAESGRPTVQGVGASERAAFAPAAIEQSNVDVAQEFSRMIMTQAAYNASSVSFRTIDEMTMTARDLGKA